MTGRRAIVIDTAPGLLQIQFEGVAEGRGSKPWVRVDRALTGRVPLGTAVVFKTAGPSIETSSPGS